MKIIGLKKHLGKENWVCKNNELKIIFVKKNVGYILGTKKLGLKKFSFFKIFGSEKMFLSRKFLI